MCQVCGRLKLRTIANIPSPTGIVVTEGGAVFLSSSKEHALFTLKEEEIFRGTRKLVKVSGGSAGHSAMVSKVDGICHLLCASIKKLFLFETQATKQ